jgi:hypothetical protein
MNPLSVDIKDILETETAFAFGTDLFIGKEPKSPDDCLTIYDTGGSAQNSVIAFDESTVQIRARGKDYQSTWQRLNTARLALQSAPLQPASDGATIIGIWASSSIMFLAIDSLDRNIFTLNFRVIRELSTAQAGHRRSFI